MLQTKTRGFSAFELLLIVTISSIVAVALAPIVETARERGRSNTCMRNLRTCGIALRLYLDDYDATLPSSVLAANPPGGTPTQAQVIDYLTAKGTPWPVAWDYSHRVTWPQVLRNYFRDVGCVVCPSDYPHSRVSYWYKYAADLAWRDKTIRVQKEYNFVGPSDQITFYEHSGWHAGDAAGIKNGVRINAAYGDTHVETITVKNGPTAYPTASDERSGASAIRLGEPMYYNYDYDTLTYHPGVADYIDPRFYADM